MKSANAGDSDAARSLQCECVFDILGLSQLQIQEREDTSQLKLKIIGRKAKSSANDVSLMR